MLIDEPTGLQYKLQPSTEELKEGIIGYNPVQHAHLWDYITVNSITYTNQPYLVDWDTNVEEWNPVIMGQWPFGNSLPQIEIMQQEVFHCLDKLDADLDFEEWVIDQEQAALDDADDEFDDDNDDDADDESEDEGYLTDEESYSEDDNEWGNFGLAPMLMNIFFINFVHCTNT